MGFVSEIECEMSHSVKRTHTDIQINGEIHGKRTPIMIDTIPFRMCMFARLRAFMFL